MTAHAFDHEPIGLHLLLRDDHAESLHVKVGSYVGCDDEDEPQIVGQPQELRLDEGNDVVADGEIDLEVSSSI